VAREKKHRIATDAGPDAWVHPFADLHLQGRASEAGNTGSPPVPAPSTPTKERLLLRRETAHRGGKTVLVLEGFSASWDQGRLAALLHDLKSALGCGGKLSDRKLEIQGEQAERLKPLLGARGFEVKQGW
jgi:translation initiation factor 1